MELDSTSQRVCWDLVNCNHKTKLCLVIRQDVKTYIKILLLRKKNNRKLHTISPVLAFHSAAKCFSIACLNLLGPLRLIQKLTKQHAHHVEIPSSKITIKGRGEYSHFAFRESNQAHLMICIRNWTHRSSGIKLLSWKSIPVWNCAPCRKRERS